MPKPKKTHCKRGHPRTPENLNSNRGCIICSKMLDRKWREDNPDYQRDWREKNPDYDSDWRKSNIEKVLESGRKARLKWKENNPVRARASEIAARIKALDSNVVYQYLLERGDVSVCDICQQECSTGKALALDHDHETGEIRGFLCTNCNTGLGRFKDSVKLMELAAEYLKNKGVK